MPELRSGTVTFVFTDIEGSTRLARSLQDRWPEVRSAHRGIVRAAFAANGGEEVDTQGDSFFYVFARARDAALAAAEADRALAAHGWPAAVRPLYRRPLVIGATAGVLAAAVAVPIFALAGGSGGGAALASVDDNAVGVVDAGSRTLNAQATGIETPQGVTSGAGAIWVS